jgi:PAS domain S-box-containing protein
MGRQSSLQVIRVTPSPRGTQAARRPGPAFICLIFLLFGVVWNLFMLFVLPSLVRDPAAYAGVIAWKDWAFLAISALLLYLLIRHLTGEVTESEQLYRSLVENAGSIILAMDREGNITFFNRRAEEVFGFRRGEVTGKSVIGTIVPATESSGRDLDQLMQEILATPTQFLVNRNENVNADGERVWVSWTNQAIRDGTGFPVGVVSVGTVEGGG